VNNQHEAPDRPFSWWTTTFRESIASIGTVVLILSPWDRPIPLTRAWCLWEIYCAVNLEAAGVKLDVRLPAAQRPSFVHALMRDFSAALSALVRIDVASAEAFNDDDRSKILQAVESTVGTARLNALAAERLRLWFRTTALDAVQETRHEADSSTPLGDAALGHAKLCSQLGTMLVNDYGDLAAARPLLERSLHLREAALAAAVGEEDQLRGQLQAAVAVSHNALGVLLRVAGDFATAKEHHRKALALQRDSLGEQHSDVGITYNNMAVLAQSTGDYAEALQLLQKDLAIAEKEAGGASPSVAATLNNMAHIYFTLARYPEAVAANARALQIRVATLGETHPDTAQSLNNQAMVLARLGDAAAAAKLHERALAAHRVIYGDMHTSVAASLSNLGQAQLALGDAARALELLMQALAIQEALLGSDHADVATTENNVAMVLERQGRAEEALVRLQRMRAKRAAALGETHALVAQADANTAMVLERLGRLPEALELGERALQTGEAALGPDSPEVASTCNNIGSVLAKQGEFVRALAMHQRALDIRSRTLGETHSDVASSFEHLASVHLAQGAHTAAIEPLKTSLAIRKKLLLPDAEAETQETLSLRLTLAQLAKATGDNAGAAEQLKIVVAAHTSAPPLERATLLNNLGSSLMACGEASQALVHLEEARVLLGDLGMPGATDSPGAVEQRCALLLNMGKAKRAVGEEQEGRRCFEESLDAARKGGMGGGHPLVQALLQLTGDGPAEDEEPAAVSEAVPAASEAVQPAPKAQPDPKSASLAVSQNKNDPARVAHAVEVAGQTRKGGCCTLQ
jgi:tetratricopeptide (TPR) repeat protein